MEPIDGIFFRLFCSTNPARVLMALFQRSKVAGSVYFMISRQQNSQNNDSDYKLQHQ
jgi:hypothetical protein